MSRQRIRRILSLAAVAILCVCPFTYAQVTVTTFAQLQTAVTNFNSGAADVTINVGANFTVTSNLTVSNTARTLTIKSADGVVAPYVLTRGFAVTYTIPREGLFIVNAGAHLIFENIIIDGSKSAYASNATSLVCVNGGRFTIEDGAVLRNNSTYVPNTLLGYGGGIDVVGKGTLIMNGGAISGNESMNGGGVHVQDSSTFIMNGGIISDNNAISEDGNTNGFGGGVYLKGDETSFLMGGGMIHSNNAGSVGGGVHIIGGCTFTINGGKISDNTAYDGGGVNNSGGVFTMNEGEISNNSSSSRGGGVSIGVSIYDRNDNISYSGGTFSMNGGKINSNTVSSTSYPCYGGGVYVGYSNATFEMTDGEINDNTASSTSSSSYGGGVYVSSGTFTMDGGKINGNNTNFEGGGVFVSSGIFIMTGGEINGNIAGSGGGVSVFNGTFTMTGGEINGNNTNSHGSGSGSGSGVYVSGTFTMDGGKINGNTGGGVFVYMGVFYMSSGEINGNTGDRGGVAISNSIFTMSNGKINGNTGYTGGVAVSYNSIFTISGGVISNNFAENCGVYITYESELILGGTAKIYDNINNINRSSNVHLSSGQYITLGTGADAPRAGMNVGVTASAGDRVVIVETGAKPYDETYFFADEAGKYVIRDNAQLVIITPLTGAVTDITNVPTETIAGNPLTLTGTVIPSDAVNQTITWSVIDAGTTGAVINSGNILSTSASAVGSVVVRAAIANGLNNGMDFTKNFIIEVKPKPLTGISRNIISKYYNGTTTVTTFITPVPLTVSDGVINGDEVSLVITNAEFATSNAGTNIPVTAQISLAGASSSNYILADSPVLTGNIIPKNLTAADVAVVDKIYDGTTTAIVTGTLGGGVVSGDDVTLVIKNAEFAAPNVGTEISVTAQISLAGASSSNYLFTDSPVLTGNIIPKNLTAANIAVQDKVYDGTTTAVVTGTLGGGVISGDEVTLVITNSVFTSPNAGTAIPVTAQITLTGASSSNYSLSLPVVSGNIIPKNLTAADVAVVDKIYDGTTTAAVTGTLGGGVISGDEVTLVITNSVFTSPNAGTGIPVTAQIFLEGASSSNYLLAALPPLTGNITPKPLAPNALSPVDLQTYTGRGITPPLTVMDGTKELTLNADYTASYTDNVSVGNTAAVAVTGIGNYTGELSETFVIVMGYGPRLFAGPSPARKGSDVMNFFWQGENFGSGTLYIYDKLGNIVNTVDISDKMFDNFEKRRVGSWNLTNRRGRLVSGGVYLVKGAVTTSNGKKEKIFVMVGVL